MSLYVRLLSTMVLADYSPFITNLIAVKITIPWCWFCISLLLKGFLGSGYSSLDLWHYSEAFGLQQVTACTQLRGALSWFVTLLIFFFNRAAQQLIPVNTLKSSVTKFVMAYPSLYCSRILTTTPPPSREVMRLCSHKGHMWLNLILIILNLQWTTFILLVFQ